MIVGDDDISQFRLFCILPLSIKDMQQGYKNLCWGKVLFLATILRPWLKGKVDYITEQIRC